MTSKMPFTDLKHSTAPKRNHPSSSAQSACSARKICSFPRYSAIGIILFAIVIGTYFFLNKKPFTQNVSPSEAGPVKTVVIPLPPIQSNF